MQPQKRANRLSHMKNLPHFRYLLLAVFSLSACNRTEDLGPAPCTGVIPVKLGSFEVKDGFYPMNHRFYWLYNDTLFDKEGNIENVSVRMVTAKEAYTHSFREPNSPILVSFSSILPDLAFRNDSVFLTGTNGDLHKRNCVRFNAPFFFPTTDTMYYPVSDTLMPYPQEIITPAGNFSNNYLRKNSRFTYIFNREVGLLHFSIKEKDAQSGELWIKRSAWLKEAVLDPSYGRLSNGR